MTTDPLPPELPQLKINPSAIRTLILMLIRVVAIVCTALGVIIAFVRTKDLAGLINWIKSEDFLQFLAALGLLASFAASVWTTLSRKWREVYLAHHVPDKIAIVVAPSPAPSVEALPVVGTPPPADAD